jgi:hypothetical protein
VQPNFELRNVSDFRLGWSRAAKDATIDKTDKSTL